MNDEDRQRALVTALLNPGVYPHPVERVEHRETHISHVLLAGGFAYKIKKPLDLGFLDFSTLERRAHFCAEEIRLNGRLAPGIYLDVVAIGGTPAAPRIAADDGIFEYAVRMRRFDDGQRLDLLAAGPGLDAATVTDIADQVAAFHEAAPPAAPADGHGSPAAVHGPSAENFRQLRLLAETPAERERLAWLEQRTEARFAELEAVFAERLARGRVRECHGDLHLANMVRTADGIAVFDGIEFDPALRWIDVASEIAFLVMDLDRLGHRALAGITLDQWLARTGDYDALRVLRFYLVYRALVRAKVQGLRARQAVEGAAEARAAMRDHVALAARYAAASAPALILTHGVAGSGKSTAAGRLVEDIGAIRLRSDVERRRLYPDAPSAIRYAEAASDAVHARLEALAATAVAAGWPVVVDATFLERRRRAPFIALARRLGVPLRILDLRVSAELRDRRIEARTRAGRDPSQADTAIAARQAESRAPLSADEQRHAIAVDNDGQTPRMETPVELGHARGLRHD